MTDFGSYSSQAQWGPREAFIITAPFAALAANTTTNFTVGTYTMPFAGQLVAELQARVVWTANQTWFRAWLSPSSPAPTTVSQHAKWSGYPGGFTYYAEMPVTALWPSLAAGTVVTVICSVYMGTLGAGTVHYIGGLMRATPT